jgi:hypothetical protein
MGVADRNFKVLIHCFSSELIATLFFDSHPPTGSIFWCFFKCKYLDRTYLFFTEMGVGIQKGASACSCWYKQRFGTSKRGLQTPVPKNSTKAFTQCYAHDSCKWISSWQIWRVNMINIKHCQMKYLKYLKHLRYYVSLTELKKATFSTTRTAE